MEEPAPKYTTNEQAQATTRFVALIFLAIGWSIAYWVWPNGIMDVPIGGITVGTLLQAIASGVIALFALFLAVLLWM